MAHFHHIYDNHNHLPFSQIILIKLCVAIGILLSSLLFYYRKKLAEFLAYKFNLLYSLSLNKWYVDEFYEIIFTNPIFKLASIFWRRGDKQIIDKYGPNGVSWLINIFSKNLSLFQSGYLYHYAFVMLGGLVIILTWFVYY